MVIKWSLGRPRPISRNKDTTEVVYCIHCLYTRLNTQFIFTIRVYLPGQPLYIIEKFNICILYKLSSCKAGSSGEVGTTGGSQGSAGANFNYETFPQVTAGTFN